MINIVKKIKPDGRFCGDCRMQENGTPSFYNGTPIKCIEFDTEIEPDSQCRHKRCRKCINAERRFNELSEGVS